ncbi:hypothetical protein AB7M33_000293 [Pseudomonas sp. Y3 TE3536]
MSNSLAQLLAHMSKGSVTLGWGAVAAYSRQRLNQLLERQYFTRLKENTYLPPFSDSLTGKNVGDSLKIQGLGFGSPLLSFDSASMSDSKATVTMNIIKGTVITTGALISDIKITEAAMYWLEMEVDLETVVGEVDPYGRVTLNLAKGASFKTNLLEEDEDFNQLLIKALESWMHEMPARCAMFDLGTVDFKGYEPLTPKRFILRTQAAPGARVRGASNQGDGAVLMFIRLRDNTVDGQSPDDSFPYLLPDGDYSATLVLNKDMLSHASDEGLELLASLLFPELNAFVKKEDHVPLDLAVFGNIDPLRTSLTVEPAQRAVIAAGKQQPFVLYDGEGKPLTASRWSAVSPQSNTPEGHGKIDKNGLYTAPSQEDMGEEIQTIIVIAEYDEGDNTYSAAARLLVTYEGLLVTPSAVAFRPARHAAGVDVWNAGEEPVGWELLEPPMGELATLGERHARFSPHRRALKRTLTVQEVQAAASEQRNAALIMVNGQPLVTLEPPFVPKLAYGGSIQLNDVQRIMPNEPRRWRVLGGAGSVTPSGQFTASAQHKPQSNVVACEVVRNGVVFAAGYSVLKTSALQAQTSWKSLQRFTITVGKSSQGTRGTIDSNGYQQLEVEVTVETQQVDGKDYKLSPAEIASMTLYDRAGQKIPGLCDNEEGIGSVYGNVWRTSLKRNIFLLGNESSPVAVDPATQPVTERAPEDRTIRQIFYLQRRGTSSSQVFYAGFQAASGEWFYSNDTLHNNATIEVQVRTPEPYKSSDYTFIRKRVAGGGGDLGGADPEHLDFDDHPITDDYWMLDYKAGTFYTAEFVKTRQSDNERDVNTSLVRWESSAGNEVFHSYTGYLFQNQGEAEPEKVSFDGGMAAVLGRVDFERPVATEYEASLLVIANFRNWNRSLSNARGLEAFTKMSKALRVQLRDARGNLHLVQIDYLPADTIGDRNVLVHSVPSRPTAENSMTIRLTDRNSGGV